MKAPGLILISFLFSLVCWSQEVVQDVISTSGGEFSGTTLRLDWTIGEISTETLNNGSFLLSQGFHQGYDVTTKEPPTVITSEPVILEPTLVIVGGNVTYNGGVAVTERGIFWGTEPNPLISGTQVLLGSGSGLFSYALDALNPATNYFVIAYAVNSEGVSYGDELSFCTVLLPKVTTSTVVEITDISAVVGGEITCNGGDTVSYRGVYWGLYPEPELTGSRIEIGDGVGTFTQLLQPLDPQTIYFVKAFATNEIGTAYGEEVMFTTLALPVVITSEAIGINNETALVGGEVIFDGGDNITDRGIFWGTSPDPDVTGDIFSIGIGIGVFEGMLTSLEPATLYYVKAYATNSIGTAIGSEIVFTTLSLPQVNTVDPSEITYHSAYIGGEVTSDGLSVVTDRGVYWGIDPDPEISGTQFSIGSGIGEFGAVLENLNPSTLYFYKAYATNAIGTSLGTQMIFETLPDQGGIPEYLVLADVTINSTSDTCLSATETITVAGNGSIVEVLNGGYLQLIAGKSIVLKDGFSVYSGGGFHAYIDSEGNYCLNAKSIITTSTEGELLDFQNPAYGDQISFFSAYPNPTLGVFSIRLTVAIESAVKAEVYSMLGELLLTNEYYGEQQFEMDLSDRPKGIYIIRVLCGDQFGTEKMIRK
ncbi:MAG: T9SS type A sorting domain-containing protein [Bacteroidales bacterium]|nr:T9SS type A sorting domain-containing protein [Bacteroidales bacterium]